MSTLIEYLAQKRDALLARRTRIAHGELGIQPIKALVRAEGRSGVRRIRIRDFQVISDSPPDFAGYDLGPGSPELALGALGSCLTHSYLIHAADRQVPIEALEVEVSGQLDARAGQPGHEATPVHPHALRYVVRIASPASTQELADLRETVERLCPILNLLKHPQHLTGTVERVDAAP